jgi:hypothetical protein
MNAAEKKAKAKEIITKGLPTVANINRDRLGKKFPEFLSSSSASSSLGKRGKASSSSDDDGDDDDDDDDDDDTKKNFDKPKMSKIQRQTFRSLGKSIKISPRRCGCRISLGLVDQVSQGIERMAPFRTESCFTTAEQCSS